jgi:hypothetical protein
MTPVEVRLRGTALLPPNLGLLIDQMHIVSRRQLVVRGWGSVCREGDHQLEDWRFGVYRGRALRLRMCVLCETVEVRDVTRERSLMAPHVNSPDELLGWYSGARANGRVHL